MIHSWENTPFIVVHHDILNIFRETNLKIFDISWIRASLLTVPLSFYIPKVEVINITGTFLTGNSVCMSSGLLLKNLHVECKSWPTVVNVIRLPRSSIYPSCNSSNAGLVFDGDCYNLPPGLEILSMQISFVEFILLWLKPVVCFNQRNVLNFLSFRGTRWPAYKPFAVFQGLRLLETFDLSGMRLSRIPRNIHSASDDLHAFVMNKLLPSLEEELTKEKPCNCENDVMPFITGFDMTPGENIEDQMQTFIKDSFCVIGIISEHFLESPYCSRELEIAQLQRKIIPLCIDNCKQKINYEKTQKIIKDVMKKYAYIQ
ncbi:hypothetical protein CHS0354_037000 [Potamilus streckersoni]|uniref:TIR domain-containing protein n=1 Tax=Potamilus streckersoni TaxID=2493646 RepID=A0AAE0VXA0_9BIVA|nr:hypothetical protein CHS0354_037000 [Potamilus streckersoni]